MRFSKSVKDLILSNDPFNSNNHASPDQVLFARNKLWRLPGKVRQRRAASSYDFNTDYKSVETIPQ